MGFPLGDARAVLGSPSNKDQPSSGSALGGAFSQRTETGATTLEASPGIGATTISEKGTGSVARVDPNAPVAGAEQTSGAAGNEGAALALEQERAAGSGPRLSAAAPAIDASEPLSTIA